VWGSLGAKRRVAGLVSSCGGGPTLLLLRGKNLEMSRGGRQVSFVEQNLGRVRVK